MKYGVTADCVLGLEVVLADGEVLRTGRRTVKGVAGYDLTRLFVGSEGTLGITTEATLSLRPTAAPPETVAATFADAHVAALGVASGVRAKEEVELLAGMLADAGALDVVVADQDEGALLLAARRQVLTAFEGLGEALIDDVCVPRDRLADLVDGVESLASGAGLTVGLFGHAGDGNFHPTVVFDASVPREVTAANRLFEDIMLLGLDLGGTITGEHGVGTLKRDLLAREVGEVSMRVHRGIKTALDPLGILNPGKVF